MEKQTLTINSNDLIDLYGYLTMKFDVKYEKQGKDYFILAFEDFYFRNNSTQLELIVVNIVNKSISIDAIAAAGGSGIFNWNLGSENSFIDKFIRIIDEYKTEKWID